MTPLQRRVPSDSRISADPKGTLSLCRDYNNACRYVRRRPRSDAIAVRTRLSQFELIRLSVAGCSLSPTPQCRPLLATAKPTRIAVPLYLNSYM